MAKSHDITEFLKALHPVGVFEIRAYSCPEQKGKTFTSTASGYFDDHARAARECLRLGKLEPPGVYVTANPVSPDLLALSHNRCKFKVKKTAADTDITSRVLLYVDIDPTRLAGISSTDAELSYGEALAVDVRQILADADFAEPIYGMSGNGYCLLYSLAPMPADDASKNLIAAVLKKLKDLTEPMHAGLADVDESVHNAGRILKVLGTWARKGDDFPGSDGIPARPHRQSWHEIPEGFGSKPISRSTLEAFVGDEQLAEAEQPKSSKAAAAKPAKNLNPGMFDEDEHASASGRSFDLEAFIDANGVPVRGPVPRNGGGKKWVFSELAPGCQGSPSGHAEPESAIIELMPSGAISAGCRHERCTWGWAELREHYEPRRSETSKQSIGRRKILRIAKHDTPVGDTLSDLTRILIDSGDVYRRGNSVCSMVGGKSAAIDSPSALAGVVRQYAEVVIEAPKSRSYRPLPIEYSTTWLHSDCDFRRLPEITALARTPQLRRDGTFTAPGYDRETGVYTQCDPVAIRHGTARLDDLLREFAWASPADRSNYIGLLLTPFLQRAAGGFRPLGLISANQPGLGKTTLANLVSVVRDGFAVPSITYSCDELEFEKQLSTQINNTTIVIDNARTRGAIESATLERSVTSTVLSYRLLGTNRTLSVDNSHQFVLTANQPKIGDDLRRRAVLIRLHLAGDPNERSFSAREEPTDYAVTHLAEIRGELMGMIQRWWAAGHPLSSSVHRMRQWAGIVGGVLEANGEPDFLENADSVAAMDPARAAWEQVVAAIVAHGRPMPTSGIVAALRGARELQSLGIADGASQRSTQTVVGSVASRFAGQVFSHQGREYRFDRLETGTERNRSKYTQYAASLVDPQIQLHIAE